MIQPERISLSVLVTTLNEAENLPRCLATLSVFDEIVVIDSGSSDATVEIAKAHGARVVHFQWNGCYPKKRQWCLDHLDLKHERIFFVDGDEEVTPELAEEIRALDWSCAGYFVKGRYMWNDQALRYGLQNNKLVLFDRSKIEFPVVDDLDIEGMGEMEGHYQPVLKADFQQERIGQLKHAMLHYAYEDSEAWKKRHERYACWESRMIKRGAYPKDPVRLREALKKLFRQMPFRGVVMFFYTYILKGGLFDGYPGFSFARSRYAYCRILAQKR